MDINHVCNFKHIKRKKMFLNIIKSMLIISLLTACGGGSSSGSSDNSNDDDSRSSLTDSRTTNSVENE